jgi:Raf kinase inhibitor-like YbhB/YbcL family protein
MMNVISNSKRLWLCAGMLLFLLAACAPVVNLETAEPTQVEIATVTPAEEAATDVPTPAAFELTSTAFEAEGVIPDRYSCKGEDVSPELNWGDPPAGTQSLAIIFEDPDASARGWVHWVIYAIPAEIRHIAEAVEDGPVTYQGMVHGTSNFGTMDYRGPCPPQGATHRYVFTLYALDVMLDLEPGANEIELLAAMDGHILAQTVLAANYTR